MFYMRYFKHIVSIHNISVDICFATCPYECLIFAESIKNSCKWDKGWFHDSSILPQLRLQITIVNKNVFVCYFSEAFENNNLTLIHKISYWWTFPPLMNTYSPLKSSIFFSTGMNQSHCKILLIKVPFRLKYAKCN